VATLLRSDSGSRGGRSRESHETRNCSLESEVRRRTCANRHRRRICGIRELDRNRPQSKRRFRFQQLMNTKEIDQFVRGDRASHGVFQGVFSVDTLPDKPRLLVCNTDPSSKPGSHWIVIFADSKERGEYFDLFGRKPTALFEDYTNKKCARWIFNTRQLQNIVSSYCGFYCCFYCMLRCRGFDLTRIVKIFTGDTGFNDSIVRGFVCNDGFATD
jgi:hypothetical protein